MKNTKIELKTKPAKILRLEEQYHLSFKSVRFVGLSNDNTEGFKIKFKDMEAYYVFLDKLKISHNNMFDVIEQSEILSFIYNNKNFNMIIIFDIDKDYAIMFPCKSNHLSIKNRNEEAL